MSSTSQKHRNFVGEPHACMRDKEVTEMAGIGPALGGRKILTEPTGYIVLGQFLVEELFPRLPKPDKWG